MSATPSPFANTAAATDPVRTWSQRSAQAKTGAVQQAIFQSACVSSIATDENGVIQIFNVGAVKMLGCAATDVVDAKTFADIADASAEAASIALPIMERGRRLNFKAITECVETREQADFLRANGCDQAQGYCIARPMSVVEFEKNWLDCPGFAPGAAGQAPLSPVGEPTRRANRGADSELLQTDGALSSSSDRSKSKRS